MWRPKIGGFKVSLSKTLECYGVESMGSTVCSKDMKIRTYQARGLVEMQDVPQLAYKGNVHHSSSTVDNNPYPKHCLSELKNDAYIPLSLYPRSVDRI